MPSTPIRPESLTLRAYQVGFGDCFLLTFHYPKRGAKAAFDRHVLVDCGSSALPKGAPKDHILRVTKDIATACGGKLDAVVVTHRHLDHLSGFARQSDGKGSGDILRALRPDVVVQPWTEDPEAQKEALAPTTKNDPGPAALRALTNMQAFAASVVAESHRLEGKLGARRLAARLKTPIFRQVKDLAEPINYRVHYHY
jgi:glyoxylase-like metal-dependent hydrolase (beta-lactamase superfamily II)